MRKLLALAASAMVVTVAFGATPAQAQCPGNDGSLPGSGPRVVTAGPFYIDDRDFADADDDGDAGGLWIYMESTKKIGLQRGGDQIFFVVLRSNGVDPDVPRVNPVVLPVKNPTTGQPVTLFPQGLGGGSLAEEVGSYDDCLEDIAANRDNIVF